MPASGRHLGAGVSAPCVPQSLPSARRWRLDPPGGAPGRAGPRGPSLPPAPRPSSRPSGWRRTPPWRRHEARGEEAPCPRGHSRLRTPYPPLEESPAPPLAAASPPRKGLARFAAGRRYRVGEGAPRLCPNLRRKATSPRARTDARTPAALGVQSPPPCCHQAPGPRQRLPPAAAEPSAACRPSRRPPRPAYPRAPRRSLASYPLCDQPRPAADARWLLKENRAGCPPGHPRPSISGGDPSRAGTVGREQRAQGPH